MLREALDSAMQKALGIVRQLSRPQEAAFLGGLQLESLDPELPRGPLNALVYPVCFRVVLQLLQVGEPEGRKLKEVLAKLYVRVHKDFFFTTYLNNYVLTFAVLTSSG